MNNTFIIKFTERLVGHRIPPGIAAIVMVAMGLLVGCTTPKKFPPVTESEYFLPRDVLLQPGDEIELKFFYTPQLDMVQAVRPDGKIQLQLVGEVEVEGRTPSEIRAELYSLYAAHLKDPEVAVIVKTFHDRRIYVGGEVKKPGVIDIPGKLTAIEAIIQAGGALRPSGELANVVIIRQEAGQRYGYSLDLKQMLEGGHETRPFYLQPGDIVYVPQTQIEKVAEWVNQHITRVVRDTGFFWRHTVGTSTIGIQDP